MYKQHLDPDILIPQHISRRALISGQFLLYNCIYAYSVEYFLMSFLLGSLYITTMLFWNKQKYGAIRTIDTIIANTLILRLTFSDSYRWCPEYQIYWRYVFCIAVISYGINDYLLYMQVKRYNNKIVHIEPVYTHWLLKSLNYTNPNTYERELAYYRCTYNHMFFIHFMTAIMSYLFVTLSYYQCNWKCE